MATIMEKDVLIEYLAGTMIDIRKIGTEKDRMKLKILRSAIYSVTAEKINFAKTADEIKKIREKYAIS
jgi:predicted AAA+ superfamily ATPase